MSRAIPAPKILSLGPRRKRRGRPAAAENPRTRWRNLQWWLAATFGKVDPAAIADAEDYHAKTVKRAVEEAAGYPEAIAMREAIEAARRAGMAVPA